MQVFMKVTELAMDITKPRRIDWALYFAEEHQARSAARDIESEALGVTVSVAPSPGQTAILASLVAVLDLALMLYLNRLVRSVAAHHGGQFDGWGATLDVGHGAGADRNGSH
jgi:hypothetical protein